MHSGLCRRRRCNSNHDVTSQFVFQRHKKLQPRRLGPPECWGPCAPHNLHIAQKIAMPLQRQSDPCDMFHQQISIRERFAVSGYTVSRCSKFSSPIRCTAISLVCASHSGIVPKRGERIMEILSAHACTVAPSFWFSRE